VCVREMWQRRRFRIIDDILTHSIGKEEHIPSSSSFSKRFSYPSNDH
jgi:hypothetical protein